MTPLRVLAVGVQRGGEPALGGPQLTHHEVGRLKGHPAGQVRAGGAPQMRVDAAQQGVVVEHLLEVRDDPLAVHGVAGEAAAELVVDPAARHGRAAVGGHLQGALGARTRVVAQQELDDHGRRELGRAAEAAVLLVVVAGQPQQGLGQLGFARQAARGGRQGPAREIAHDAPGHLGDLLATVCPGCRDPFEHLLEGGHAVAGLGREVRAEVEGFGLGRQEDGHRPATLASRGLHGLHVHGVDVGPLLTVDLHRDEVRVEVVGDGRVLEGLVGHHVAPVARGVADAEQHGDAASAGLLERLRRPRPPVDGVVSVLKQIGRGHASQPVHAGQPLTALLLTVETARTPPHSAEPGRPGPGRRPPLLEADASGPQDSRLTPATPELRNLLEGGTP